MRRYWINFKGKQSGPHSLEALERMGVDKTAYVWHSGLDDWVKITKVPELNEMLEKLYNGSSAASDANSVENVAPQVMEVSQVTTSPPEPEPAPELSTNEMPNQPGDEARELPPNRLNQYGNATYQVRNHPQYAGGNFAAAQATIAENPECPPTNLVWAIIATICCCMPLGILAIIFASLTKKNYKQGDYRKAEKYSEYSAWSIIFAIMIGLITTPLSCCSNLMLLNLG
ncbi:MAG: CD225/dispanin family protein [Muribaculaceae bacterium]|nr:CD225/dispanin family protein [Muribaculaceae bacterium]